MDFTPGLIVATGGHGEIFVVPPSGLDVTRRGGIEAPIHPTRRYDRLTEERHSLEHAWSKRVGLAPLVSTIGSVLLKVFYSAQNIDFVLSFGNTGVAEGLSMLFGPIGSIALVVVSVGWLVWSFYASRASSTLLSITIAAFVFFFLGFVAAIGYADRNPPGKILKSTRLVVDAQAHLSKITADIFTRRLAAMRNKDDKVVVFVRAANNSVDKMRDENFVRSQEFSIPIQDEFSVETDISSFGRLQAPPELLEIYILSIPATERVSEIRSIADAKRRGGRLLDESQMGFAALFRLNRLP
ncbi:MAG: hypothetical protein NTV70_15955 [Acidobacteria bacterium]|nr:hypothetical protein [Acidobacteriota bacterium]